MSALSDSTTSTMSPASTLSPTPLSHCEILPSFIVDESAGIMIGVISTSTAAGAAGAGGAATGAALGAPTLAMSASFSTRIATGAPTAAVSPSATRILAR